MWTQGNRVVQDPVHGLMQFRRQESLVFDLLKARELQRLRRIRQLGFASFVFPGAEHSRFVHALGASFLAARVGRHLESIAPELLPEPLRPDHYSIRDFCIAALCHDLGHGPFSHVWERVVIGDNWDRKAWKNTLGISDIPDALSSEWKWHEMITNALIGWSDGQLHRLLEGNEAGSSVRVRELLSGQYYLGYLCRLLNSDIDVDRCDFLLRDGLMAGLPFGRFQLDRLISCLTFGFDSHNRCHIGLDASKGLHPAIELLKARSGLYEVLYFHKTVMGMEWLLECLVRRLKDLSLQSKLPIDSGMPLIGPIIEMLSGKPVSLDKFLQVDDYSMWVLIRQIVENPRIVGNDVTATDLATRFVERDPLRSVPVRGSKIADFVTGRGREGYDRIEREITKYVKGEAKYFYKVQELEYIVLEEREKSQALLVHSEGAIRRVSPLIAHEQVRPAFPHHTTRLGWRLLVPREARDDIARLIEG